MTDDYQIPGTECILQFSFSYEVNFVSFRELLSATAVVTVPSYLGTSPGSDPLGCHSDFSCTPQGVLSIYIQYMVQTISMININFVQHKKNQKNHSTHRRTKATYSAHLH